MRTETKRVYFVLGFGLLSAGLLFLAVLTPVVGSQTDLSIYNSGWNGASQLARSIYDTGLFQFTFSIDPAADGLQVSHLSFTRYALNAPDSVIIIVGPDKPFTTEEIAYLKAFVEAGGILFLADDFGTGNAVLAGIGAETRIAQGPVLDLVFDKQPQFAMALNLTPDATTRNVTGLVLNRAAPLLVNETSRPVTVLASTTEDSWVDLDGDGALGEAEPQGPFPVFSRESLGRGQVYVLGDPSILSNSMLSAGVNRQFAENIVKTLTAGRHKAVVDESHRDYTSPVGLIGTKVSTIPSSLRLVVVFSALGVFLLSVTGTWGTAMRAVARFFRRLRPDEGAGGRPSREALLAALRAKHPAWSESDLSDMLDEWGVVG